MWTLFFFVTTLLCAEKWFAYWLVSEYLLEYINHMQTGGHPPRSREERHEFIRQAINRLFNPRHGP